MRLLLDTDALIWSQQQPEKLGERARSLLKAARANPRWISAASALEIACSSPLPASTSAT